MGAGLKFPRFWLIGRFLMVDGIFEQVFEVGKDVRAFTSEFRSVPKEGQAL
jgi:hypothetical protein